MTADAAAPIRVLVVDDSAVMRRLLTELLQSDPAVTVVGTAANGRIALSKIAEIKPDLMTLDVEMPELDGLGTVSELRRVRSRIPVIMLSSATARGAAVTIDALTRGANDYVTKPANMRSASEAMGALRDDLLAKIKIHAPAALRRRAGTGAPSPGRGGLSGAGRPGAAPETLGPRPEIVAIGVSTGGPNALALLIPALPADLPVPIVIVQHMPDMFTRLLAERLTCLSAIPVEEGAAGTVLRPGRAYLAPGSHHMTVEANSGPAVIGIHHGPPESSCRPAVDVLFRSVAAVYKSRALALILTGMGRDGLEGCRSIRAAGGEILVQDEASSVVWGMPGAVARAQLANGVHPLDELPAQIVRRLARSALGTRP